MQTLILTIDSDKLEDMRAAIAFILHDMLSTELHIREANGKKFDYFIAPTHGENYWKVQEKFGAVVDSMC